MHHSAMYLQRSDGGSRFALQAPRKPLAVRTTLTSTQVRSSFALLVSFERQQAGMRQSVRPATGGVLTMVVPDRLPAPAGEPS